MYVLLKYRIYYNLSRPLSTYFMYNTVYDLNLLQNPNLNPLSVLSCGKLKGLPKLRFKAGVETRRFLANSQCLTLLSPHPGWEKSLVKSLLKVKSPF